MLLGILTFLSGSALAHDPGLSAAEVRVLGDRIVAEVSFAPQDLAGIQPLESDLLTIHDDNGPLERRSIRPGSSDQNSLHYLLEFSRSNGGKLRISAPVLANLPRGHRQFCSVYDEANKLLAERLLSV